MLLWAALLGMLTCGATPLRAVGVDLSVRQTATPERAGLGSNVVFAIAVTNVGTVTATTVSLTNPLPAGVTFISAVATVGNCSFASGVVSCAFGTFGPAQGGVVTLTVRPLAAGSFTNIVSAASAQGDAAPSDNVSSKTAMALIFGSVLSNPQSIALPELDGGPGNIYPSTINVSGLTTAVYNVTVTLHGLSHVFPDDLDVLLVAPGGFGALLMSDTGGDGAVSGVTLTFTDDAGQVLPDSAIGGAIQSGTYRPTNFGFDDDFPPPAPPGPYGNTTSFFEGIDPNGAWSLYVVDDLPEDAGSINNGWSLRLTTSEPISDLRVTATASPPQVNVGSNLTYTILLTNQGPSAATGVALVDDLPASVSFVSATASQGSCALVNGRLECALGTLTNRARATVVLTVTPQAGGEISERFTVSSVRYDPHLGDNEFDVDTVVNQVADLGLQGTLPAQPIFQDENLHYRFFGTNYGPAPATSVVFKDILPPGVAFFSAFSTQGLCTNQAGVVTCQVGTVAVGAGFSTIITVRPSSSGMIVNRAGVSSSEADVHPGNNDLTNTFTVVETARIVLRVQAEPNPVLMGQSLVYHVSVSNQGPSVATSVMLTNPLPASVILGAVTPSQGSCTNVGGVLHCALGSLDSGAQATITIRVLPQAIGALTNLMNVAAAQGDPVPSDNVVAIVNTVLPAADLQVTLADGADPLALGDILSYAVRVRNNGPHSASSVTVTNPLPPQTVFVRATTSQGSCTQSAAGIRCTLGQLDPGAEANLTFEIRPTTTATVTNEVAVSALEADPSSTNNVAREETTVLVAAGVFSNPAGISIPIGGVASPYPSTIFVAGITVRVDTVTVTISNLTHSFLDDVDILLVGPSGQSALLMSDAGGGTSPGPFDLTFADNASAFLADDGPLSSGRYRPSNHDPASDVFPLPAPAGPYGATLSVFRNVDPNGTWSLYVMDDADKDGGQIVHGWSLALASSTDMADVGVVVRDLPSPVALASNLTYQIAITNHGPSVATNVNLTDQLPAGASVLGITVSQGSCTNISGVISCQLGTLGVHTQAMITVLVHLPTLGNHTNMASVGAEQIDPHVTNNMVVTVTEVRQRVVITTHPIGRTINQGESVDFVVAAMGTEPILYQWLQNGLPVTGATNSTLTISNSVFSHGGEYSARVSNLASTEISLAASLTVLSPPSIQTGPLSRTNFAGSTATFNVGVLGTAPLTYQWSFNGTMLTSGTNATLSLPSVRTTNAGSFRVRIANTYGAITSSIATLVVHEVDFGDAPHPGYPTLLASNAAHHYIIPGLRLGTLIDFEPDGRSSANGSGDDTSGTDDEDGVRFLTPLHIGQTIMVEVVASTNGYLNAWLDFNANQSWTQGGEQIFTNQSLTAGTNLLSVAIPLSATTGNTFARFRFSSVTNLAVAGPAPDGEVEDYFVPIAAVADLAISMVDAPDPVAVGTPFTYTIAITNLGPSRATLVSVTDPIPSGVSYVSATASRGSCGVQSGTVICTFGSVSVGESITVVVTAVSSLTTTFTNVATVVSPPEADLHLGNNSATNATSVLSPPIINAHPQGGVFRRGSNVTLFVEVSGSPSFGYQWVYNGMDVSGRTNTTLVLSNVVPAYNGNYSVRVSNQVGTVLSANAGVVVADLPAVQTLPATNITTDSARLRGSVDPGGLPSTAWFEWGPSTTYGLRTAAVSVSAGQPGLVEATLSDLANTTPIHFRIVATNHLGMTVGADRMFTPVFDPRPRISNVRLLGAGRIRFEYTTTDQASYVVQASTNLVAWETLGPGNAQVTNRFEFIDTPSVPHRFYRITSP